MPKQLVPIVAAVFVMLFLWLSTVPLLSWYEFSAHHQALQDAMFQWSRICHAVPVAQHSATIIVVRIQCTSPGIAGCNVPMESACARELQL